MQVVSGELKPTGFARDQELMLQDCSRQCKHNHR